MLELSAKQLRAVQLTELEMLQEVHRICEEQDIPYVIIAGTLLGAVRHKGFIPWDDDVDVALLRPDYERFRKACETGLDSSRFVFQDDRNTPGYRWGYGKLRRKDTLFLREYQEDMSYFQGIFLDIFPLDEVPVSYPGRVCWNIRCWLIRKCLWARIGKQADRNPVKRRIYALADHMPEKWLLGCYHRMIRRSERLAEREEKTADHSVRRVRILLFPTPNREFAYYRHWYEKRNTYTFEDGKFYGIHDADAYLRFKFGDYEKLPPEKERKTHPVSRLELLPERENGR